MIKQDTLEKAVKFAYLGLGSNLGNRIDNIRRAKNQLYLNNIEIVKSSSYYESLSWPNKNNPKFINVVFKIKTSLDFKQLLKICKKIEKLLGRRKSLKNSPRECDIDIIDFNNMINSVGVKLPHPRMHKRNFVLFPLFEINKNWKHPITKQHIKTLIFKLSNSDISSIK